MDIWTMRTIYDDKKDFGLAITDFVSKYNIKKRQTKKVKT